MKTVETTIQDSQDERGPGFGEPQPRVDAEPPAGPSHPKKRFRVQNLDTNESTDYDNWSTAFKPVTLLPVPYVSQLGGGTETHTNDCGAACAIMLLRAYTHTVMTPDEFYASFNIQGDAYLSIESLRNAMGKLGVLSGLKAGLTLADLFDTFATGKPVVVSIRYKTLEDAGLTERHFEGPHFAVGVGIDSKYVYLHDPLYTNPLDGDAHPYPLGLFWRAWKDVAADPKFPNPERSAIIPAVGLGYPTTVIRDTRGSPIIQGHAPSPIWQKVAVEVRQRIPSDLSVVALPRERTGFSLRLSDASGRTAVLLIALHQENQGFYRRWGQVVLRYLGDATAGSGTPPWLPGSLRAVAEILGKPEFSGISRELAPRPFDVVDLVRAGLKPAAAIPVQRQQDVAEIVSGVPAWTLSDFRLRPGATLAADSTASDVWGPRMLYVGQTQELVDAAAGVDRGIYVEKRGAEPGLHFEFGRLMGFPECCARAFASAVASTGERDGPYDSLRRLGWSLKPVNWRLNYLVARIYTFPFLGHVPCSADCAATRDQVGGVIARLYPDDTREIVASVLRQGVIVWPDGRMILMRPHGRPSADGAIEITGFNQDLHVDLMDEPRPPESLVPPNCGEVDDSGIAAIRVVGSGLQVRLGREWRPYAGVSELLGSPLVLLPL
jgi:hypothetical protein